MLIFFHLLTFYITSTYALYKRVFDFKKSILLSLQERTFPFFAYASIFFMLMKIIFGIDIDVNYLGEILFALLFCLITVIKGNEVEYFDVQIFLTGQIFLVISIGWFFL